VPIDEVWHDGTLEAWSRTDGRWRGYVRWSAGVGMRHLGWVDQERLRGGCASRSTIAASAAAGVAGEVIADSPLCMPGSVGSNPFGLSAGQAFTKRPGMVSSERSPPVNAEHAK
jgi:hypothetical protein